MFLLYKKSQNFDEDREAEELLGIFSDREKAEEFWKAWVVQQDYISAVHNYASVLRDAIELTIPVPPAPIRPAKAGWGPNSKPTKAEQLERQTLMAEYRNAEYQHGQQLRVRRELIEEKLKDRLKKEGINLSSLPTTESYTGYVIKPCEIDQSISANYSQEIPFIPVDRIREALAEERKRWGTLYGKKGLAYTALAQDLFNPHKFSWTEDATWDPELAQSDSIPNSPFSVEKPSLVSGKEFIEIRAKLMGEAKRILTGNLTREDCYQLALERTFRQIVSQYFPESDSLDLPSAKKEIYECNDFLELSKTRPKSMGAAIDL